MLSKKKIAVIGLGKLGETLVRALLNAKAMKPGQIRATTAHSHTIEPRSRALKIKGGIDNRACVKGADIIILSVKPQAVGGTG